MQLALGTPYTRVGASDGYLASLAAFSERWGVMPGYKGYLLESGCSYGRNRNRIVARAMAAGAEWLLQIDDDIRFPVDLPERMIQGRHDARVILGVVPIEPRTPVNVFLHPEGLAEQPALPVKGKGDELRAIKGFGGAVMLVHLSVYDEMADAMGGGCWYNHEAIERDGALLELEPDLSFARRLMALGITAWARYGLPLTHSKPHEYRFIPQ